MHRFFFHVHDGKDFPDEEGTEYASAHEATAQAVTFMGEELKDADGRFWDHGEWSMHVVDENGATVCRLRFSGERSP